MCFCGLYLVHKGYKCLNSDDRIFITPSVQFNETDFPFAYGFGSQVSKPPTSQNPQNSPASFSSSGLNPLVSSFPFVSIPSVTDNRPQVAPAENCPPPNPSSAVGKSSSSPSLHSSTTLSPCSNTSLHHSNPRTSLCMPITSSSTLLNCPLVVDLTSFSPLTYKGQTQMSSSNCPLASSWPLVIDLHSSQFSTDKHPLHISSTNTHPMQTRAKTASQQALSTSIFPQFINPKPTAS